jgi:hypothetical protein
MSIQDSIQDPIEDALAEVIRASVSPEVQEAQVLLLRRLALEGSVFPTRIPAPKNITEIGGYLNLLELAGEKDMRTSAIASALGLASPAALSWDDSPPQLGFRPVTNNLGAVPAGGLPISVPMRADLAVAWTEQVLPALRALGAVLPLWAPPMHLPDPILGGGPVDPLASLGRVVWVAPAAALRNPDTDVVTIGRADTDVADIVRVMVRVDPALPGSAGVVPLLWNAIVWDELANIAIVRAIGAAPLVPIEPLVALAGFTTQANPSVPRSRNELSWGRLTNTTGLLAGVTTLGDELRLVWSRRAISRSVFANRLDEKWNGSTFAP